MKDIYYPSLKNKIIIVTGATSGIGNSACQALLDQGAKVIGLARDKSKLSDSIVGNNDFHFESIDLTNFNKIEILFKRINQEYGKFDGIVHCAGKEETIPLSIYKNEKIKSIFDINVLAGIELLRVFSKKKMSNENSSVIFLSSVMGELGQPGKVGYCASKSAVLGVVKAGALELSKRKIRINAISPGVVKTPMTQQLFSQLSEENINEIEEMHPLGTGEVEDVIPLILFLLSKQSKWITGQNYIIDGGYSIQ